jgi:hypothetical protein
VFIALVNSVWTVSDAVANNTELNDNQNKVFNDTPDLAAALNDPVGFAELVNDFVAMTLHTQYNIAASGNDPDCRMLAKQGPDSPPVADATFTLKHFNSGAPFTADYTYTTQTLGGNLAGTIGPDPPPANTIRDPSMLDWSFSRDTGPGAPRLGANWPTSQISYGVPGSDGGYNVHASSGFYSVSGSFYITFNDAGGQQHTTTLPLYIHSDATGIHPSDSEVATAIIAADSPDYGTGFDFACNPAAHSQDDPALNPQDKANYPCLDWFADQWLDPGTNTIPNPKYHFGTMLIVRGSNADGDGGIGSYVDWQVNYDITVKGDLAGWNPIFVGHGGTGPGQYSDCTIDPNSGASVGGICLLTSAVGIPMAGDVVQSKVLWPQQLNDVCQNDPATCSKVPSYGWATPYPVQRECQSVIPAAGMFAIEYVGTVNPGNPSGSCNNAPTSGSATYTPSIRYRSIDGNLWTAWRVPPTVGTANFLNILSGKRASGPVGIVAYPTGSNHNAFQLAGSGTHWLTEFKAGDNIMVVDPSSGQRNNLGGFLAAIRTVETVLDDTTINLSSSLECVNGTDGNDCIMFSTIGYDSFSNPADGSDGGHVGMFGDCSHEDICIPPVQDYPFDVYHVTGINPGYTCPTWNPATDQHPPADVGCYYSDSIQFQSQTYTDDGQSRWWNVSLPSQGSPVPPISKNSPTVAEPWLNQPVITQQPVSVLVGAGANTSFTAAASGTPAPTVQWQLSTDSGAAWNDIGGATSTTYNVNGVTLGLSGRGYRAIFTNTAGSRTTHSATLGVTVAPQITSSPSSASAVQPGDTITLTGTASGAPVPAATWQLSQDNGVTWHDLNGATSTLAFIWPPPPTPQLQVRVVYSNASGSAMSDTAVIIGDKIFNNGFQ